MQQIKKKKKKINLSWLKQYIREIRFVINNTMATKNVSSQSHPQLYQPYNQNDTPPLGPRKTIFVLATVIGCIAILWPKIFYPMMFGGTEMPQVKNNYINKDLKPGGKFNLKIILFLNFFLKYNFESK